MPNSLKHETSPIKAGQLIEILKKVPSSTPVYMSHPKQEDGADLRRVSMDFFDDTVPYLILSSECVK